MAATPTHGGKQYPKDALVIISMMKELGITEYEPRVVTQLLEFSSRYVTCVLDDAKAFANHSKKKSIDVEDVKLAIMMQLDRVFTSPPPRDLLLEVARTKNSIPLPIIKPHCGIRLPPDRYCFSNCNYRHRNISSKKQSGKASFALTSNLGQTIKVEKTSKPSISVAKKTGIYSQGLGGPQNPVIKYGTLNSGTKLTTPKIHVVSTSSGGPQLGIGTPTIKVEPIEGGIDGGGRSSGGEMMIGGIGENGGLGGHPDSGIGGGKKRKREDSNGIVSGEITSLEERGGE